MDIKEDIGNDEIAEYQEIGETGGPELILESGGKTWPVYGVVRLYQFLKRLDEMGVL